MVNISDNNSTIEMDTKKGTTAEVSCNVSP